jgi:hypothetical protein
VAHTRRPRAERAHCDREAGVTPADVQAGLRRIDYELKPYDIVLVRIDRPA